MTAPFNLNNPWSEDDIKALLSSVDDDRLWRMVIRKNGEVDLVDMSKGTPFPSSSYHAYFEVTVPGNGYVGAEAAGDPKWVESTRKSLQENWPTLKRDAFIDL